MVAVWPRARLLLLLLLAIFVQIQSASFAFEIQEFTPHLSLNPARGFRRVINVIELLAWPGLMKLLMYIVVYTVHVSQHLNGAFLRLVVAEGKHDHASMISTGRDQSVVYVPVRMFNSRVEPAQII